MNFILLFSNIHTYTRIYFIAYTSKYVSYGNIVRILYFNESADFERITIVSYLQGQTYVSRGNAHTFLFDCRVIDRETEIERWMERHNRMRLL